MIYRKTTSITDVNTGEFEYMKMAEIKRKFRILKTKKTTVYPNTETCEIKIEVYGIPKPKQLNLNI